MSRYRMLKVVLAIVAMAAVVLPAVDVGAQDDTSASISGLVFDDLNGNGVRDQLDPPVAGVVVDVRDSVGVVAGSAITDEQGQYLVGALSAGEYRVQFVAPLGREFTGQDAGADDTADSDVDPATGETAPVDLGPGESLTTIDAGVLPLSLGSLGSIGNFVFEDVNENGLQDAGEPGVADVAVEVRTFDGFVVGTSVTDADGLYLVNNLPAGSYTVAFTLPGALTFTTANVGDDEAFDSDADPSTGEAALIGLSDGENLETVDAGVVGFSDSRGSLGNFVFEDINADGLQNADDPGVQGVGVEVHDSGGLMIASTTTNSNGEYLVSGLPPGTYNVRFVPPEGLVFTQVDVGDDDTFDSDVNPLNGYASNVSVVANETNDTVDAGLVAIDRPPGLIGMALSLVADPIVVADGYVVQVRVVVENLSDELLSDVVVDTGIESTFADATVVELSRLGDCSGYMSGRESCSMVVEYRVSGVESGVTYLNVARVDAVRFSNGLPISDLADDGDVVDANDNGNADEPDENDPTPIQFPEPLVPPPTPNLSAVLSTLDDASTTFVPTGGGVSQVVHSVAHDVLLVRNSGVSARLIDAATGETIDSRLAVGRFTDLSVTPDGEYFFLADYGARTNYDEDDVDHFVHRYEIATGAWTQAMAPAVAWRIEAVSASRVLLQEQNQHVDMTINSFDAAGMVELDRIRADYYGDFEYDAAANLIFHGSTGSSSQELHVRKLVGDELVSVRSTGIYGAGQGGGPTTVLAADGAHVFYGRLQFASTYVGASQHTYPSPAIAATANFVFLADGTVFFIPTREPVGALGWEPKGARATRGESGDIFLVHPDNKRIFRCVEADLALTCPGGPAATSQIPTPDYSQELSAVANADTFVASRGPVSQLLVGGDSMLYAVHADEARVIDTATGVTIDRRSASGGFVDASITPDGSFLFVLESGPVPLLHRYDVEAGVWTTAPPPDSGNFSQSPERVEALDGRTVFLANDALTRASYFPVGVMVEEQVGWGSISFFGFDPPSGALWGGRYGDSLYRSVYRDGELSRGFSVSLEVGGSAEGDPAFSADGQRLFFRGLQLEAADPSVVQADYRSAVLGATATLAVTADGNVWYSPTGEPVGALGWEPSAVYAPPGDSGELWIAHPDDARIFRCVDDGALLCDDGAFGAEVAPGDVNCDGASNIIDALMISQYTVEVRDPVQNCGAYADDLMAVRNGDVDASGETNIIDALLIAQCDAALTNVFCPEP